MGYASHRIFGVFLNCSVSTPQLEFASWLSPSAAAHRIALSRCRFFHFQKLWSQRRFIGGAIEKKITGGGLPPWGAAQDVVGLAVDGRQLGASDHAHRRSDLAKREEI